MVGHNVRRYTTSATRPTSSDSQKGSINGWDYARRWLGRPARAQAAIAANAWARRPCHVSLVHGSTQHLIGDARRAGSTRRRRPRGGPGQYGTEAAGEDVEVLEVYRVVVVEIALGKVARALAEVGGEDVE